MSLYAHGFGKLVVIGSLAAAALIAAGCSVARPSPSPSTPVGEISATVAEWKIDLSATSAPAGRVAFNVANQGTTIHEFVVIRTDMMAGSLPMKDGMIDIAAMGGPMGSGMDMPGMSPAGDMAHPVGTVGLIDEIAAGGSAPLVLDNLAAGHYAIVCDLPGHYPQGMHADFTVGP